MHTCRHVHMCACVYGCTHTCINVYMHTHTYSYMYSSKNRGKWPWGQWGSALEQEDQFIGNPYSDWGQNRLRPEFRPCGGMKWVDLRDAKEMEGTGLSAHKHRLLPHIRTLLSCLSFCVPPSPSVGVGDGSREEMEGEQEVETMGKELRPHSLAAGTGCALFFLLRMQSFLPHSGVVL